MRLEALLRAHGFMKVERPPEIWEADTELERFVPLLGEMIAAGLSTGTELGELTLSASNIVVEPPDDDDPMIPAPGDYVGITVSGPVDFGPDARWYPGATDSIGVLARLTERFAIAGVRFAYVRRLESEGSFTIFLSRVGQG
jgi:hypothetical protein